MLTQQAASFVASLLITVLLASKNAPLLLAKTETGILESLGSEGMNPSWETHPYQN